MRAMVVHHLIYDQHGFLSHHAEEGDLSGRVDIILIGHHTGRRGGHDQL
jgi:hypothetical protein